MQAKRCWDAPGGLLGVHFEAPLSRSVSGGKNKTGAFWVSGPKIKVKTLQVCNDFGLSLGTPPHDGAPWGVGVSPADSLWGAILTVKTQGLRPNILWVRGKS